MSVLLPLLVSVAGAAAAHAQEPPSAVGPPSAVAPEIQAVTFPGAASLARDVLLAAIETRPSTCRNPLVILPCLLGDWGWAEVRRLLPDTAQVHLDAERLLTLYEIWGFPDAQVTPALDYQEDGDVEVAFHVQEGAPLLVGALELRGLEALSPPVTVPRPLPLQVGEPYALPRLQATEELLRAAFAERGRPYAAVSVSGEVDEAAGRARILLEVEPGPAVTFGPVTVAADAPVSERAVRERLAYAPGDPFRPSALAETERALYALPVVERAVGQAAGLDRGATSIPTRMVVEPARTHGFDVEGTLSSTDCLEAGVYWRHRWFLGGPRVLALGVVGSNLLAREAGGAFPCAATGTGTYAAVNHALEAELWQPWPGSPETTLRLRGWSSRISAPDVFVRDGKGGSVAVGREVRPGLGIQAEYEVGRNELHAAAAYFCGGYGVCSAEGIARMSAPATLATAGLTLLWNSAPGVPLARRPDVRPGRAWTPDPVPDWRLDARLALDGAAPATGSDYTLGRALGEFSATRVVGRTGELAARVRGGFLAGDDVVPPELRLFSGGPYTVRGAEQNLVGPGALLLDGDALPPEPCTGASCAGHAVDPNTVTFRPVGGDRLVEASVEARLWLTDALQVAAFLDAGRVSGAAAALPGATSNRASGTAFTPGVGLRLLTDLGPIRVDLGFDTRGARHLPLLLPDGAGGLRPLGSVLFDPYAWDHPGLARQLLRRLQLHMAIGQPF